MLLFFVKFSFSQNSRNENLQPASKENPKEVQVAKNQVVIELSKEMDENGNVKVVSKEISRVMIPESFPKFIDTGNPKTDEANYHDAKQKWIKEHPEEFEKIKHLHL